MKDKINEFFLGIYIFIKAFLRFFDNKKYYREIWVDLSNLEKSNFNKFHSLYLPKIIWIYWDSEKPNYLVDFCIYNTQEICQGFDIRVLNKESVSNYLDLPEFHKDLKVAHVADYIRLGLLSKYGGIWMDASVFLTQNLDWIFDRMRAHEAFVFFSDDCTLNISRPIVENWFIVAPLGSKFIKDWFEEYKKCIFSSNPISYYFEYISRKDIIQNIPNIDYLMCYVSAAIVMNKRDYELLCVNSGSTGHYYNYKFVSSGFFVALTLLLQNKTKIYLPKLVKFTNDTRNVTNFFIKFKIFFKKSLFGERLLNFYKLKRKA